MLKTQRGDEEIMLGEIAILLGLCVAVILAVFAALWVIAKALGYFFNWPYESLSEEKMIELYFSQTRLAEKLEKS